MRTLFRRTVIGRLHVCPARSDGEDYRIRRRDQRDVSKNDTDFLFGIERSCPRLLADRSQRGPGLGGVRTSQAIAGRQSAGEFGKVEIVTGSIGRCGVLSDDAFVIDLRSGLGGIQLGKATPALSNL